MRKTIGLALIGLAAALALLWYAARSTAEQPERSPAASAPHTSAAPPAPKLPPTDAVDPAVSAMAQSAANATYPVDLDQLRARLPDNLYWTLGAPTDDAEILRARAERARQSNELYGKVLSTTASEAEVRSYYADKRRVSEDYIQFAELVLAEHREQLPDEHIGLYELSIRLHRARLVEIPRDMDEALARLRAKQAR
ncbi:MAG TPA: hypothetical protein VNO33_00080 [Kofleriaceae bacterium]|nr:hypothetical protein [Kofleriaceae bacterium]